MDYYQLQSLVQKLPEEYTELCENNHPIHKMIKEDVVIERLVEKGIFKDWNEILILCSKKYHEYRNSLLDELEKMEKDEEDDS